MFQVAEITMVVSEIYGQPSEAFLPDGIEFIHVHAPQELPIESIKEQFIEVKRFKVNLFIHEVELMKLSSALL